MAEKFLPLSSAEEDSDISWYKSFASGIVSGLIKIPEGVVSLGAELIDLGADTDTAADVEQFFDKINIFEEDAQERAIGKLTEAIVQVGVPGTVGFKLANKAARGLTAKVLKAKKNGAYADFKKSGSRGQLREALNKIQDLNKKAKYGRYTVGVMGGAAGEVFVADVENIGTFGDMFERGVTQLDRQESSGGDEASRKLLNRLKFGSESLLLTPIVFGIGKSSKLLAQRGQELAYSNSKFDRWLDKYIRAPFSPRGALSKELFADERIKQSLIATDSGRAKELVDNITKIVDGIYPKAEKIFGKSTTKERDQFYNLLNDSLFKGDLRKKINFKSIDDLLNLLKKTNVDKETRQSLVGNLNSAREEFVKLIDILDSNAKGVKFTEGSKQLQSILKSRTQGWIGTTYRMFEERNKLFKFFSRYRPTGEAEEAAINFFKTAIKKTNPKMGDDLLRREATAQVKNLITSVAKLNKPTPLQLNKYISKTMEGKPGGDFIKQVVDDTQLLPKELRDLFGEIRDPRYSIYNAMTNLSTKARTAAYLTSVLAKNDEVQKAGGRGFFWASEDAGRKALRSDITGIEFVNVGDVIKKLPGAEGLYNPLADKFTTKEIAEAILNINNVGDGLQGFVRGKDKEGAAAAASWLYRNLLIFPKGLSQLSKTVFSIPTHIRNMLSAVGFSGANGILFENPMLIKEAFSKGIDTSGLTKLGPNSSRAQEAYRELTQLGVVNSQVQIGDLKALLKDVKFGEQAANLDSILSPFMRRMTKLKDFFQGKYVAEDDTFKITNYVVELDRLKKQVAKGKAVNRNLIDLPENELILKFNNAKQNKTFTGTYDEFLDDFALKTEAANIVKNTVPNYSFVGSFVRTSRLLPVGNFMSFPSEMIRTSGNIIEQGLREMRHKPAAGVKIKGSNIGSTVTEILEDGTERVVKNNAIETGSYGVGIKRLLGMAAFSTAAPVALTEGAKALYDVSEEELQALRRFVPEWSKNSTLIPTRSEDGDLRYTDFSHTNAYDVINRPFRTVINNIQEGTLTDEQILEGFAGGLYEASAEIMNPFLSESIWTEASADIFLRNGRTEDGRRLYTDQTSLGDKISIINSHLIKALAPNMKPYTRVVQALTETPTERGEEYDVGPEIAGFMGLRAIKVNPLRSMDFKISEYQRGIRNSRREFTGGKFGVLKGGQVKPNDIIIQFAKSNNARFGVQQNMFLDLSAAEILGVNRNDLQRTFKERALSNESFRNLRNAKFDAYSPSEDIENKFRETARDLGGADPYRIVKPIIRRMIRDMNRVSLRNQLLFNVDDRIFRSEGSPRDGEEPNNSGPLDINNYLLDEIETPPLPPQPMPNAQVLQPQAPGNIMASGLTPIENALLSEEEKMIKLRQRGMIT